MKVKKDDVKDYLSKYRTFSFTSTPDTLTTGIALLELCLNDSEDCRDSSCPFKRKTYYEVYSLVQSLRSAL